MFNAGKAVESKGVRPEGFQGSGGSRRESAFNSWLEVRKACKDRKYKSSSLRRVIPIGVAWMTEAMRNPCRANHRPAWALLGRCGNKVFRGTPLPSGGGAPG